MSFESEPNECITEAEKSGKRLEQLLWRIGESQLKMIEETGECH